MATSIGKANWARAAQSWQACHVLAQQAWRWSASRLHSCARCSRLECPVCAAAVAMLMGCAVKLDPRCFHGAPAVASGRVGCGHAHGLAHETYWAAGHSRRASLLLTALAAAVDKLLGSITGQRVQRPGHCSGEQLAVPMALARH